MRTVHTGHALQNRSRSDHGVESWCLFVGGKPGCRVATLLNGRVSTAVDQQIVRRGYTLALLAQPKSRYVPLHAPAIDSLRLSYALTIHSAEVLYYYYTDDGKSTCHLGWIRSPRAARMTLLSRRPSCREATLHQCVIVHLYSPTGLHLMHVWQISPALSLVPHNARDTYPHATLHLLLNQTVINIIMCLRMKAEARQSWPGLPIKFPCVPVVCAQ